MSKCDRVDSALDSISKGLGFGVWGLGFRLPLLVMCRIDGQTSHSTLYLPAVKGTWLTTILTQAAYLSVWRVDEIAGMCVLYLGR